MLCFHVNMYVDVKYIICYAMFSCLGVCLPRILAAECLVRTSLVVHFGRVDLGLIVY